MTKSLFRVHGLDCAACAAKLEKIIASQAGVRQAQLNFTSSTLEVTHDLGEEAIMKKVSDAGYKAEPLPHNKWVTEFYIRGLDCSDCAAALEKMIASLAGVERAEVNFPAGKMTVVYTGSRGEIMRAIARAGYRAEVAGTGRAASFWLDKKIILTVFSGFLLGAGLLLRLLGVPGAATDALFLLAILGGGLNTARSAIYALRNLSLDMNLLMTIAVTGAIIIGELAEAAAVVFLFAAGNALQAYSVDKTRNSIRQLMELAPDEALVKREGKGIILPVKEITAGEIIIVRPGEKIALDGVVVAGTSEVNQAPITGEAKAVAKFPASEVFAGSINGSGVLEVRVTRPHGDTTLDKIIKLVDKAQAEKAPLQQLVDRFARYYTPAVIVTAVMIATAVPLLLGHPFQPWLKKALILLVISCPCALVISTPVAVVSAIGAAARQGVLIKGGTYLEAAGSIAVLAFDKTGTLTSGQPELTEVIGVNGFSEEQVLRIAAALESRSPHPLAGAVLRFAASRGIKVPAVSGRIQHHPGKGVSARLEGKICYIGSPSYFKEKNLISPEVEVLLSRLEHRGRTVMLVGRGDKTVGLIAAADRVRAAAAGVMQLLRARGIKRIVMLTGDSKNAAREVAQNTFLDGYSAEMLPGDKVAEIRRLQKRYGRVAMIGDGINDAPALATADVGIAMGAGGSDVALETADIALMSDELEKIPYLVQLGKNAVKRIKENIAFAILIKVLFVMLTFWDQATMWMAVFADSGAALLVTMNGLRLMRQGGDRAAKSPS